MKLEPRGKYAGVKIHLDKEEAEKLIELVELAKVDNSPKLAVPSINFALKLGKKINELLKENPNLLKDRTEEEVQAALSKEAIEAAEKLKAIGKGVDWKKIKVEVMK